MATAIVTVNIQISIGLQPQSTTQMVALNKYTRPVWAKQQLTTRSATQHVKTNQAHTTYDNICTYTYILEIHKTM